MPLVLADKYMCAEPAGSLQVDGDPLGEVDRDEATSDEELDLQSSLAAVAGMAAAGEAPAADGVTAAVPGAEWAVSPATTRLVAHAASASAAASAADPTSQPAGRRAGGLQLPLPAGQSQLISLAPPSLAEGRSRSEAPAVTMAAAAQSLTLGLPSSAGAPTQSMALAAATGQAAAGPLSLALQPTAARGAPSTIPNGPLATELLSMPALSAGPGLLPRTSAPQAGTPAQRLPGSQAALPSAAGAGAAAQPPARSRQSTRRLGEGEAAGSGGAATQQPP